MRGTVSAGMALSLQELGFLPAFDAVYGSSAGAITGAWLVSSRPEGMRGWAESIPLRTPIAQGATHIVVLRSRPARSLAGIVPPPRPPREARLLARTVLRKETPELRAALLSRAARTLADVTRIREMEAAGLALSIHPPAGGPLVSRLTTDGAVLAAAFEAGREATHALSAHLFNQRILG
jgi:predicted patatin/cPLA2 family phospholipase